MAVPGSCWHLDLSIRVGMFQPKATARTEGITQSTAFSLRVSWSAVIVGFVLFGTCLISLFAAGRGRRPYHISIENESDLHLWIEASTELFGTTHPGRISITGRGESQIEAWLFDGMGRETSAKYHFEIWGVSVHPPSTPRALRTFDMNDAQMHRLEVFGLFVSSDLHVFMQGHPEE